MFHPSGPTFSELMVQALSSTERGYDLIAPRFEFTPFRTPDALLAGVAPYVGRPAAAIDVCCGTGAGLAMLKPLVRDRLVGIDFSQGMLDEAAARVARIPVPPGPLPRGAAGPCAVELVRGDVLTHPFRPEFDVAVSFGAFGHIRSRDQATFARQIHAALVPGGRFVFVTADPPSVASRTFWVYHGFNAVMRVRNAVLRPQFIMYYLNFLLPRARKVLGAAGFELDVHDGVFPEPFSRFKVVVATKP